MPRNGSDARQLVGSLARTSPRDPGRSQAALGCCLPAPTGSSPCRSAAGASAAEDNHLLLLRTSRRCATAPGYVKRTLAGFVASSETFPLKAKKKKGINRKTIGALHSTVCSRSWRRFAENSITFGAEQQAGSQSQERMRHYQTTPIASPPLRHGGHISYSPQSLPGTLRNEALRFDQLEFIS